MRKNLNGREELKKIPVVFPWIVYTKIYHRTVFFKWNRDQTVIFCAFQNIMGLGLLFLFTVQIRYIKHALLLKHIKPGLNNLKSLLKIVENFFCDPGCGILMYVL